MNWLSTKAKESVAETVSAGIEEKLVWLCRFGRPKLYRMENGWHCCIDMNTNTTGSKFEVSSEYKLASPSAAVDQLIERMLVALAAVSGGKS
jgi:hypothetical protein